MGSVRWVGACATVLLVVTGCTGAPAVPDTTVAASDSVPREVDSIPEERPDSVRVTAPDSTTMLISLLPGAPGTPLSDEAAGMAERAVFAPRTQRWFMVRAIDGAPAMDVGRIDGGVGTTEGARAAFASMLTSQSPVQVGMPFTMHTRAGAQSVRVTGLRLSGRRILATFDAPAPDSAERVVPTEWRGSPALAPRTPSTAACSLGDTTAISAAIARYTPAPTEAMSVIRGCFGDFRALLTIRPLEITPESIERVVLVRASGGTRGGKLRDLSYPLHELLSVADVDGDGIDEIIVHSFRPAMETWASLRMTDSVTFTRFASGFTIEKR